MQQTIVFEHPLNERMRLFLRAEHLFQQIDHRYENLVTYWDTRDCVNALIELYNLIEQTEFRNELIKETDRHLHSFQRITNNTAIDQQALNRLISDLETAGETLRSYTKQNVFPKNCDLLGPLRQRSTHPNGMASFDFPGFHHWMQSSVSNRQRFLKEWMTMIDPMGRILHLVIQLSRESHSPTQEVALDGQFQKGLPAQSNCQLLRIHLRTIDAVYPEISANRLHMNIRFLRANGTYAKSDIAAKNIPFELTCCMV